ncbi:macrophage migration inhibitory factor-like [Diadema antillarum]|uniref:macrophage migration inhibitory factor-like n=1 Tax=Diadema antillarum TaxID=105358 RepID=UPI003A8BBDE3
MPILHVSTNVKDVDIPSDFQANLSSVFQKAIGKPEKYIMVHLLPNQMMMFGGSREPLAKVDLASIGNLGVEENKVLTQVISAELGKIGIKPDRIVVVFKDIAAQDAGWNNTTFAFSKEPV